MTDESEDVEIDPRRRRLLNIGAIGAVIAVLAGAVGLAVHFSKPGKDDDGND